MSDFESVMKRLKDDQDKGNLPAVGESSGVSLRTLQYILSEKYAPSMRTLNLLLDHYKKWKQK